MKTLKIILSSIFVISIEICIYRLNHILFWSLFAMPNIFLAIHVFMTYHTKKVSVVFKYIKPVTMTDKIRIFGRWENVLCDVINTGELKHIGVRSISESCEIAYIQDHYKEVFEQLKEKERRVI
jgi:hypothetical protein